jgi:hypothetical protein
MNSVGLMDIVVPESFFGEGLSLSHGGRLFVLPFGDFRVVWGGAIVKRSVPILSSVKTIERIWRGDVSA